MHDSKIYKTISSCNHNDFEIHVLHQKGKKKNRLKGSDKKWFDFAKKIVFCLYEANINHCRTFIGHSCVVR